MSRTLSARGYSDEEIEQIENIVEGAEYLDSKSDFLRTASQYALSQAVEGFKPDIDNFEEKVSELGLDYLNIDSTGYFDLATTAYTLSEDPEVTDAEYREIIGKLAGEKLEEDFAGTGFAENIL